MAETYKVNKRLNNRMFGETINIQTETDIRKLVNASAFLLSLSNNFNESDKKYNTGLKSMYDGFLIDDWRSDISLRIKELTTIYCYENVEFTCLTSGGIKYTLCDGTVIYEVVKFGINVIKSCIRKDSLVGSYNSKERIDAARLQNIKYIKECKSETTTTTTLNKG